MHVLGIETSCDETACAIYSARGGLLAHALYSQVATHADYGGVVPELASRDHVRKLIPLARQVLEEANLKPADLSGVAYTAGPGLVGALLVGAAAGRGLAWALSVPAVGVHHMEGHLLAPLLELDPPRFPFVALLVSGGHTMLVQVEALGEYQVLGETRDDAAGEAFDKTAKLLGLPYPGGPALAKLAQLGDSKRHDFPRPLTKKPTLDFSFSGLKTHVRLVWETGAQDETERAHIAASFQAAVVDTLTLKCEQAMAQTGASTLVVAGGVGANQLLREQLRAAGGRAGFAVHYPRLEFCTDNAAMIAYAGYLRLAGGAHEPLEIKVKARWPLAQLAAV